MIRNVVRLESWLPLKRRIQCFIPCFRTKKNVFVQSRVNENKGTKPTRLRGLSHVTYLSGLFYRWKIEMKTSVEFLLRLTKQPRSTRRSRFYWLAAICKFSYKKFPWHVSFGINVRNNVLLRNETKKFTMSGDEAHPHAKQ